MAISADDARTAVFQYVSHLGYFYPSGTNIISIEQNVGNWVITLKIETILTYKTAEVTVDANTGQVRKFQIIA
jgi:hypothetical protein